MDSPHRLPLTRRSLGRLAAGTAGAAVLVGALPASAAAAPGSGTDPEAPLAEFRAMWIASVVNIDWPSATGQPAQKQRDDLVAWFDLAVRLNLNAVILQVRPTADAFWPSRYEPWSQYLTGKQGVDPGYDPLAFAVAEAHRRNLELHAWFNPYRVSMQTDPNQLVPWHPARRHPDWVFPFGPKLYYNPGIPEVRRFTEDAIMDAVTRYDIDGVHFDDYFYPYPIAGQTVPDQATYAKYGQGFATIDDWRRNNVDLLVSEMNHRIHAAKPWLRFGISPFAIWRNKASDPDGSDTNGLESYSAIDADTRGWVRNNWLDYINPQVYWYIGFTVADYAKLVPWWSQQVTGTNVKLYIGEATYRVGTTGPWTDPAELSRHLTLDRQYPQVTGNVYFSATDVRADKLGATSRLVADHYRHPALTPPMPHLDPRRPATPHLVAARTTPAGTELRLVAPPTAIPVTGYAIFRFDGTTRHRPPSDFADATHLIATIRRTGPIQTWTDPTPPAGPCTYHAMSVSHTAIRSDPSTGLVRTA